MTGMSTTECEGIHKKNIFLVTRGIIGIEELYSAYTHIVFFWGLQNLFSTLHQSIILAE